MFAGDAIGNNNIQTTDTNSVKVALGAAGYTINDINMNGDVQHNRPQHYITVNRKINTILEK